ncbi:MAG TPA: HlyD family efflux transporter periplasmic adaptor subunit [Pirellulales bacterium]|jgi:RND family efflux transporter MFP subunit|nr:HlyD family efflux transporter periplasmic adaptor subunit [Pirellulales bacterium]
MRIAFSIVGCLVCIAVAVVNVSGAEEEKSTSSAHAAAAESTKLIVTKGPFEIDATLDGTFDAYEKSEIILRPDSWSDLIVREAAQQGASVKAGDVVLKLETKKLEEAIKDLEAGIKISDISLRQLESDLSLLEKTAPIDLQGAQRGKQAADEDLKYFLEKDREMQIRTSDFGLKNSKYFLDYALEELKQLEKMYRADDLREETEEIILKRQRNAVESARFNLERTEANHHQTLGTSIPREEERLRDAASRAALALDKQQLAAPVGATKARLELEKLRTERDRNAEKLEKLQHDLEALTIRAPRTGVVYYGASKLGQWSNGSNLAAKLQRGGNIQPNEVLLTIVDPAALEVCAVVPEGELHLVHSGMKGRVTPTSFLDERIPTTVAELSTYPDPSGKFCAHLTLDADRLAKLDRRPVPGMTCSAKFISLNKSDAIAIPSKAIFNDEANEAAADYVFVEKSDGKAERRDVQIGQRSADRTEITGGLKEGETILLQRPKGM